MLELLIEGLAWSWQQGILGQVLAVIIVLLGAFLIGIVAYALFLIIDRLFLTKKLSIGYVVKKEFIEEHEELVPMGKTLAFMTFDDEWIVIVNVNGQEAGCSVNEAFYNHITEGQQISVEYVTRRLSGKVMIKNLAHV